VFVVIIIIIRERERKKRGERVRAQRKGISLLSFGEERDQIESHQTSF
jgi:hypothetical protein